MKSSEVDDALESLWVLVGETTPVVIGSQSLHGKFPDVADTIRFSREVDVILPNRARLGNWLVDVVGDGTPFEAERGYFIDHVLVREGFPILADGWEGRCITRVVLHHGKAAAEAKFLSPEDLAISKLGAAREKDIVFVAGLLDLGYVALKDVEALVPRVHVAYREQILASLVMIRERLSSSDASPYKPPRQ